MKVTETIYSVYILTNKSKRVLYTGITNNLEQRIIEHYIDRIDKKTYCGKYNCHFLIYHESHKYVNDAIAREKEIKGWLRIKKKKLITDFNPGWNFLNKKLLGEWPPTNNYHRRAEIIKRTKSLKCYHDVCHAEVRSISRIIFQQYSLL